MPNSVFHESMRQAITCVFFFCEGDTSVFLRMKEMESDLSNYNGLKQMGLISLQ